MEKKEIRQFNLLTWEEKNKFLSELLHNGHFEEVIRYLNSSFRKLKLKDLPDHALLAYLSYARALGLGGSGKMAIYIAQIVAQELKTRVFEDPSLKHSCLLTICRTLDELWLLDESVNYSKEVITSLELNKNSPVAIEHLGKFKIINFRAKLRLKKHVHLDELEELKNIISEIRETSKPSAIYNAYLDYLYDHCVFLSNKYEAKAFLTEIDQKISTNTVEFYNSYYRLLKAKILINSYKFKEATEILLKLKEDITIEHLNISLDIYATLEKTCVGILPLEDQILVRTYPTHESSTYSMGNLFYKSDESHSFKFDMHLPERENLSIKLDHDKMDSWLINRNKISPINYKKVNLEDFLDLRVGILKEGQAPLLILSSLRTKALMGIIGSSRVGISIFQLANIIFSDENLSIDTIILRTQDIITQLQKLKFPITRNAWKVYFDLNKVSYPIILPRNYIFEESIFYFHKTSDHVNSKMLRSVLNLKKTQSSSYLKQWREKGYIEKLPSSSNYKITLPL
jgi:hypothetical protein